MNKRIRIYQIVHERDIHRAKFMNSAYIRKQYNGGIPADLYECIYDAEFETDDLEKIYAEFNSNKPRPEDYKGHSLSVSDVIEVISDNNSDFYICEPVGFTKIDFNKNMNSSS